MSKETLPTGRIINYQRPPRRVFWKHGRIGQTFQARVNEIANGNQGMSPEEQGLLLLESLSEDEAERFQRFADDLVKQSTGEDPETFAEIDYFTIVGKVLYSIPGAKIETDEGEVASSDVETFPVESELSQSSPHVSDVRGESVAAHGSQ